RASSCCRTVVIVIEGWNPPRTQRIYLKIILCELCAPCVLIRELPQEARPVRERADAEQLGERLPEVGERPARAEVDAGADVAPGREQRHVFARMIGTRRGRIVAVVGGDDQQIVVSKMREQGREARVE